MKQGLSMLKTMIWRTLYSGKEGGGAWVKDVFCLVLVGPETRCKVEICH